MPDDGASRYGGPDYDEGGLERLIFHLRGMREGLNRYSTGDLSTLPDAQKRRSVLLDRHDAALVRIAGLLGVALPGEPALTSGETKRLTDEGRAHIEDRLREVGLEL